MNNINKYIINKKTLSLEQKLLISEYVNRLTQNNVAVIFNLRHLRKILNIKKIDQNLFFGNDKSKLYKLFYIPKKTGGYRQIEAPREELLTIQKWIKINILDNITISRYATGFKKNCSIVDNAKPHINKEVVINLDLKDFFHSIKYNQIFKLFIYLGYTKEVSHLLTKLCTNKYGVLPQGAPTSPCISNIISLKLDKRLSKLSESFNASYTRYADDITFSGDKNIVKMLSLVKKIIIDENLILNNKKVRIQFAHKKQEVTGITVNKKLSVSKPIKLKIENAIYYSNIFGIDKHMENIKCDRFYYKEHLYGIAYFIKMIDKNLGEKYLEGLDTINWIY